MNRHSRLVAALLAAFGIAGASSAVAAVQTATNGVLSVLIEDAGTAAGMFTIRTGAAHPTPNATVFYPIGTSYITLRDNTAQVVYVNSGGGTSTNIAPYTEQVMQSGPCSAAVAAIANGFRTTYTCTNWTIAQDVVISGTTLSDTNVRHTVTVTNTSAVTRSYGLRYMWDWQIAGNDASLFRTRNPDGAFTASFIGFNSPAFQAFEEVDNPAAPTFSVFGTVTGGSLSPPPTTPDRVVYVDWGDYYDAPWDFAIAGSGSDSATAHFWGFAAPLSIAAGGTATFHQYVSTNPSAVGVGPTAPPATIPTLSQWGLIGLVALMALLGLRRARSMRV